MQIKDINVSEIKEYAKNAKKHPEKQIKEIAQSIKKFGFKQPLVLDKNYEIVIGHGRLLAAKSLGLELVPCVLADDLTEQEIKALRLADNKTNESPWDFDLLDVELESITDLDMGDFGFDVKTDFNEHDIDDFFTDAPEEKEDKEPKKIKCPHCGEWIEV